MTHTELKSISGEIIRDDEYSKPKSTNVRFHTGVQFKRKQIIIEKMKSVGEELLAWLLIISVITAFIYLFSNLE